MYARLRGRARLVRDFEELVSECGPLLECLFEAAPRITALGVCRVLKSFNFDISDRRPPLFVEDYVAVRRAGLRLDAPLCELPSREIAKSLADRHLYGVSSVVDLQRCAFERGAVIARSAFRRFRERSSSVRVISCWKDMGDEQDLRWMLERLFVAVLGVGRSAPSVRGAPGPQERVLALRGASLSASSRETVPGSGQEPGPARCRELLACDVGLCGAGSRLFRRFSPPGLWRLWTA